MGVAERAAVTSERFTSSGSLDMVHRLRRDSDGVLVGRTTVQNDNPSLTVRRVALVAPTESSNSSTSMDAAEWQQQPRQREQQQPWRIVLDTHLLLHTPDYTIFNDGLATLVYHANTVDENACKNYESEHIICVGVPQLTDGRLSLPAIVEDLQSETASSLTSWLGRSYGGLGLSQRETYRSCRSGTGVGRHLSGSVPLWNVRGNIFALRFGAFGPSREWRWRRPAMLVATQPALAHRKSQRLAIIALTRKCSERIGSYGRARLSNPREFESQTQSPIVSFYCHFSCPDPMKIWGYNIFIHLEFAAL
jgi:riboflavin biosynthesis pyrimidine reductase